MSITITDPVLLAQLAVGDPIELKDADGRLLGVFVPETWGKLPPGITSPFTDEEMAARRAMPKTGRPLADILRDLQGQE